MNKKSYFYKKCDIIKKKVHRDGCLDLWIDRIVPCLKDVSTGELVETGVIKIESRKYLHSFQKNNGWHINWNNLPGNAEVYALVTKNTNEIQGLIALTNDSESDAAFINWAVAAPHNNLQEVKIKKYEGVGGHLFAIAADKSIQWGYAGAIHGFAANKDVLEHYMCVFNAQWIGMLHQYQFFINEKDAQKLLEVYKYEWYDS